LFIHLLKWPAHNFALNGVAGLVTKAYMLSDELKSARPFRQSGKQVWVKLPNLAPDPIDSVLVLELAAEK
jgi:hypothetical protein